MATPRCTHPPACLPWWHDARDGALRLVDALLPLPNCAPPFCRWVRPPPAFDPRPVGFRQRGASWLMLSGVAGVRGTLQIPGDTTASPFQMRSRVCLRARARAFGAVGAGIAAVGPGGSYRRIRIRRCGTRLITCWEPSDFGPRAGRRNAPAVFPNDALNRIPTPGAAFRGSVKPADPPFFIPQCLVSPWCTPNGRAIGRNCLEIC
jgi:hypothetical protein